MISYFTPHRLTLKNTVLGVAIATLTAPTRSYVSIRGTISIVCYVHETFLSPYRSEDFQRMCVDGNVPEEYSEKSFWNVPLFCLAVQIALIAMDRLKSKCKCNDDSWVWLYLASLPVIVSIITSNLEEEQTYKFLSLLVSHVVADLFGMFAQNTSLFRL